MFKRVVSFLFIILSFFIFIYTLISTKNYELLNNIDEAQVAGITEESVYLVKGTSKLVIDNTYPLLVGDRVKVVYDEGSDSMTLPLCGKYIVLYLISFFTMVSGILLLIDYNTYLVLGTIVLYALQILIIAPFTDGLYIMRAFDTQVNYCKSVLLLLILLNVALVLGYILYFTINFKIEQKSLMLQIKN